MKARLIILSLLLIIISCKPDNKIHFKKVVFDLNNQKQKEAFEIWKKKNLVAGNYSFNYDTSDTRYLKLYARNSFQTPCPCVYKDSIYAVYSLCRGEFGGFLFFEERINPQYYYIIGAQCATFVDYFDGSFYITETMPHMYGFGRIVKIDDPKNLIRIKQHDLPYWSKRYFLINGSKERFVDSVIYNQGQVLLDTIGFRNSRIDIFMLYPYKRKQLVVYSNNYNQLMIAELSNKKLYPIDSFACPYLIPMTLEGNFVANKTYCYKYLNSWDAFNYHFGYIYVRNDTVVIANGRFYKPPEEIDTAGMNLQ